MFLEYVDNQNINSKFVPQLCGNILASLELDYDH